MGDSLYTDLELNDELQSLLDNIRELHQHIRTYRWEEYRRCDPFVEGLFDRTAKGRFFDAQNVVIHDSVVCNGDISIGEHTHVGQHCSLDGSGGLTIGSYCTIAPGVRIMTHDSVKRALSGGSHAVERSPVSIGDRCFIGANSVITRSVSIGNNCVIGAGAVVTKDIPSNSIVAGVPARIIGYVRIDGDEIHFDYHEAL